MRLNGLERTMKTKRRKRGADDVEWLITERVIPLNPADPYAEPTEQQCHLLRRFEEELSRCICRYAQNWNRAAARILVWATWRHMVRILPHSLRIQFYEVSLEAMAQFERVWESHIANQERDKWKRHAEEH